MAEKANPTLFPLDSSAQKPLRPTMQLPGGGTLARGGQTRRCQNNGVLSILEDQQASPRQGSRAKVREWVVPILLGLVGHSRDLDLLSLQLEAVGGVLLLRGGWSVGGRNWTQRHLWESHCQSQPRSSMRGTVAQPKGGSQRGSQERWKSG